MLLTVITPWFPSGPQAQSGNFIYDSIVALENLGQQLSVLVTQPWRPRCTALLHADWRQRPIDPALFGQSLGLEVVRFPSIPRNYFRQLSNWFYLQKIVPVLKKKVTSSNSQLIHAHTELAGAAAVQVGQSLNIPVVVTLHGINPDPRLQSTRQLFFLHAMLTRADRVVLVGEPLVEHFRPLAGKVDHFRVVSNGFRFPSVEECDSGKEWGGKLRLISVSNLHEGKGIDLNLEALALLNQEGISNWQYTVVGDGRELSSLKKLARDLGLGEKVDFRGGCEHSQVYRYLATADIFILPSYREAFGVAYLEAMACGLLAIGVRGQGPQAFINHGVTGLLVEPRSAQSLADCLKQVFAHPDRMKIVARAGQESVRRDFTWKRHAEKLLEVYRELIPA